MTAPIVRPLQKKTTNGCIYERPKNITALLHELLMLRDRELVGLRGRCASQLADLPDYVPSECVLYLVRTKHGESRDTREQLFKLLVDRVLRRLPARSGADQPVSLTGSNITDEVVERFIGMLNTDQTEYNERLDFFELRFNAALSTLTLDAKKKTWRHDKRRVSLVEDEESGELPKELQNAVGTAEAFDAKLLGRAELRARLAPAINSLPPLQRRILEMLRLDIPIYSQDPNMMTMGVVHDANSAPCWKELNGASLHGMHSKAKAHLEMAAQCESARLAVGLPITLIEWLLRHACRRWSRTTSTQISTQSA